MRFDVFKKSIVVTTVVALSSSLFTSVSVNAQEPVVVAQVVEQRGTGGSNPIVIEKLRQETLDLQAAQAEEKAMEDFMNNVRPLSVKPEQTIPVYVPDFKTIGDVQAEQKMEEVVPSVTPRVSSSTYVPDFKTIGDVHAEKAPAVTIIPYKEIEKTETPVSSVIETKFETQFTDIYNETQEVQDSIVILDALNIVSGKKNGEFVPQEAITRSEAVKISTLVSGTTVEEKKKSSVADIEDTDWSVPYIESALENEIIYTDENNNFEGETPVTADEAFALYLISAGVAVDVDNEKFPFYSEFTEYYTPTVTITNYETKLEEGEEISRGDFAELSVFIINALLQDPNYIPAEQLTGAQYSASETTPSNREAFFPEIFQK